MDKPTNQPTNKPTNRLTEANFIGRRLKPGGFAAGQKREWEAHIGQHSILDDEAQIGVTFLRASHARKSSDDDWKQRHPDESFQLTNGESEAFVNGALASKRPLWERTQLTILVLQSALWLSIWCAVL